MKTFGTVMALCLSLLLIGGLVAGASAQQQQPTAPAPTESKDQSPSMSSPTSPQPTPPAQERSTTPPAGQMTQPQQPSTNTERTTTVERTVEREPSRILGMDATLAMVLGAALLVVIVIGLVAMSRRTETVEHHHRV